jgi:hypothetical protein
VTGLPNGPLRTGPRSRDPRAALNCLGQFHHNSRHHLLGARTGIYSEAQYHSGQIWEMTSCQVGAEEWEDIDEKSCNDARYCDVS